MPVTQHPLHRSVRAELPHTAPALGRDDQASKMRPVVSARGRWSREPGSMSGTRCRQTDFPWPAAFPPPPPRPSHCRPSFVRRLPRYYAAVRLPSAMAHRRTPEGFPMRSALNVAEDPGISRFPREMFSRMHGVSDRAGSALASPMRQTRCGQRPSLQNLGTPNNLHLSAQGMYFAAQYPACAYPCQRFAHTLANAHA